MSRLWRSAESAELTGLHLSVALSAEIVRLSPIADPESWTGSCTDCTGPIVPCVVLEEVSMIAVKRIVSPTMVRVMSSCAVFVEISR